jgi:hypothetical protein
MKKQLNKKQFEIDFFELIVLTEACWNGGTILRATFLEMLITEHYAKMTKQQRISFWNFLERYSKNNYPDSQMNNETRLRVLARFMPEMQYTVLTEINGKREAFEAYLFADKFWINLNTFIEPKYILNYERA